MQCTRETCRTCKRAHECTPKHITALQQPPHPPPKKILPIKNTTTQSPHNSNSQSSLNINSRVALQHVCFQPDKSFHASQVTSSRCNVQGRLAVPASARMSARTNTSLPCPHSRIFSHQKQSPNSSPQHNAPAIATLNQA